MRGDDNQQEGMLSYVSPEKRVPADHPLRPIRKMVDEILKEMSPQFAKLYSDVGRPSIAPERLFRSLLLQIFYSVRSERMLIEQLQYNLLFRWFVGMEMDEVVWNHAVYSKNRERLLNEEIAASFFARVLERARPFMSDEHFTVDGTLIEAWASQKSFRPKDGSGKPAGPGGEVDFKGEKRKNQTHESSTDPDARLWTKSRGSQAKLSYMGHVMMENRNGLLVETFLTEANGRAERDAALLMAEAIPPGKRVTLGGDKAFVQDYTQEGAVDLKAAVVLDEPEFLEFIHEKIHSRARRPDRICQRFLRNPWKDALRLVVASVAGQQEQRAGQPLLRGIKKLIDQVRLDTNVPGEHIGDKAVREFVLGVKDADHLFLFNNKHRSWRAGRRGSDANGLSRPDSPLRKSRPVPGPPPPLPCLRH